MTLPIHEFTITFTGVTNWTDDQIEELLAINPDLVPVTRASVASIRVVRAAATIENAIRLTMTDVRKSGLPGDLSKIEILPPGGAVAPNGSATAKTASKQPSSRNQVTA